MTPAGSYHPYLRELLSHKHTHQWSQSRDLTHLCLTAHTLIQEQRWPTAGTLQPSERVTPPEGFFSSSPGQPGRKRRSDQKVGGVETLTWRRWRRCVCFFGFSGWFWFTWGRKQKRWIWLQENSSYFQLLCGVWGHHMLSVEKNSKNIWYNADWIVAVGSWTKSMGTS